MRILITGSSGQIGTNLGLRLIEMGHEIIGVDIRNNQWTDAIPTIVKDLSLIDSNSNESLDLPWDPNSIDLVAHFAASAKVHKSVQQPELAISNIHMTFNILELCRSNQIPILFSSTREVYGDIYHHITDETRADFTASASPYSASKISCEALIYSYARCYGIRYCVFRFSNVYGRYDCDLDRMDRVIPLFIHRIMHDRPITVYGEDKVLDFTYVDDCIEGILSAIELLYKGKIDHSIMNLAYGEGNSLTAVANTIANYLGVTPQIVLKPTLPGEITRYVANIDKARALLGYDPKISLETGIARAIEWSAKWWSNNPVSGDSTSVTDKF